MYKPYKTPTVTASPDVKVPQPRLSKLVTFLVWLWGGLYLLLYFGVVRIVHRGDSFVHAFKRALEGKSRVIVAFRHPNAGEPQFLSVFIKFKLKAVARKMKVRFARWPHAIFVYGYEVVRWGGWLARFIMPNLGALPIHHTKMDKEGMSRIYKTIIDGPYPLAIAPEGAVSYTTDSIPRLESGVIRIGFTAAQQLAQQSDIPVEILPVSIHFRFGIFGSMNMKRLLLKIEKACGFQKHAVKNLPLKERVENCRNYILELNEKRYSIKVDTGLSFNERLELVVNAALEKAERMLDIKAEGDFFTRMHKVKQICWDRIYLPNIESLDDVPQVKRSIMDLEAGEAWYISRHQELVDFCWYFTHPLPTEESPLHYKIEYIQNLWDFASRTMGGAIANRKNIYIRRVIIQSGPVINLTERLPKYKEDKKAAIAECLSDLEKAYLDCIDEANKTLDFHA